MLKGSWKTTLLAVLAFLYAVIAAALALFDGDPSTAPDFDEVAALWGALVALLARDNSVSSEEAGAK